ncbi:DUF6002 family protein [Nonomuraea candida]|uniref:DUF6002 family protein n=1 Tax=Nonomuraea candida TaxID=359159 RepID=UPI000693560B|nr:DUF6002 family protein [Nonomuraea candida]
MARYYQDIQCALRLVGARDGSAQFNPGFTLPAMDARMAEFLAPSRMRLVELAPYRGRRLLLLDLMGNPRTRTTKTFASLVIVARAVRFIQDTGESVVILTPTSANKGTALRDAVLRAITCGLVTPEQLRIVTVAPAGSLPKLWSGGLDEDPDLAARNPVALYHGRDPSGVKELVRWYMETEAPELERAGVRVWHTMALDNYRVGDVARAFFENEFSPPDPALPRIHAHAVSSAFGLLGHSYGRELAALPDSPPSRYFLVQHLNTPDMVLSLYTGDVRDEDRPRYARDPATGLFRQADNEHFPLVTADPYERLDSTFYTRRPATSAEMNGLIRRQGGGGIVVSGHECAQRHAEIRDRLLSAGVRFPHRFDDLRERSLSMAMTGVLNGIDRGVIGEPEVLVHGSGSYSGGDYRPLPAGRTTRVSTADDLAGVLLGAVTYAGDRSFAARTS